VTGILIVVSAFLTGSVADAKIARVDDTAVQFSASATGGLQISGKTRELSVADDGATIKITVPLANIDTGIGLRNTHTRKYLEVSKYPVAELVVSRAALQFGGSGDVPGDLTLHGQTHQVTVHYDAPKKGNAWAVHGTTRLRFTDYGIEVPSYLHITVKPDVSLDVTFTALDS
jgi:polyisoprenoid-binding protein YceI